MKVIGTAAFVGTATPSSFFKNLEASSPQKTGGGAPVANSAVTRPVGVRTNGGDPIYFAAQRRLQHERGQQQAAR